MFKIVIMGHVKAGKLTIFKNINSPYITIQNTRAMIGTSFYEIEYSHHDIDVHISLWYIDGNPRYRFLYPQYARAAKAVLVVFDVTNRESFESTQYWIGLSRTTEFERPYGFLVANKVDSNERIVSFQQGRSKAEQQGFIYVQISAFSKQDVRKLFQNVIIFVANRFLP